MSGSGPGRKRAAGHTSDRVAPTYPPHGGRPDVSDSVSDHHPVVEPAARDSRSPSPPRSLLLTLAATAALARAASGPGAPPNPKSSAPPAARAGIATSRRVTPGPLTQPASRGAAVVLSGSGVIRGTVGDTAVTGTSRNFSRSGSSLISEPDTASVKSAGPGIPRSGAAEGRRGAGWGGAISRPGPLLTSPSDCWTTNQPVKREEEA
jgi:hypothetical protein